MFLKILRDISKPQLVEILLTLKESQGMAVGELAERLGMSYMGIKQHCVDLDKLGYLDTWRQPQKVGRPLKLYRLTRKAGDLFPTVGEQLGADLLASIRTSYGPTAPEKFLMGFFGRKADAYREKLRGQNLSEKVDSLAALRAAEGHLSRREGGDSKPQAPEDNPDNPENAEPADPRLRLVEYHSLLESVAADYPSVHRMEEQMIGNLLGTKVHREEERNSGLTKITFWVD